MISYIYWLLRSLTWLTQDQVPGLESCEVNVGYSVVHFVSSAKDLSGMVGFAFMCVCVCF